MKKLTALLCVLVATTVWAQPTTQPFATPDIVVVSRFEADWSNLLITKLRILLRNFNIVDPFKYKYDGVLTVNESELGTLLPPTSRTLVSELDKLTGLDILNAHAKVNFEGFQYEVKGFKTELRAATPEAVGLNVSAKISATDMFIQAGKISLSLVVPTVHGGSVPAINIDIVKPTIRAHGESLLKLLAKIQIQDRNDFLRFKILEVNYDEMAHDLLKSMNAVDLEYERIDIPTVSLRVGNKLLTFDPDKIRHYLRSKHEALKGFISAQLASVLKKGTATAALALVEKFKLEKTYWLPTPFIRTQVRIEKFDTFNGTNDLVIHSFGDFCPEKSYVILNADCLNHKVTKTAPSRLTETMFQDSMANISSLMNHGEANIIASVSEDYLNRLIAATIDQGLWNEGLTHAGLTLGPSKIMLRLDKAGDSGTLYLDGVYKPTKLERLATGASEIRFPLILNVGFRIEKSKSDNIPLLIIRVNEVDLTDATLVQGRPDLGFESNVARLRFRSKVLQTIRRNVITMNQKDLVVLPVKELSNMSLEETHIHADGMGRAYGLIKMSEVIDDSF